MFKTQDARFLYDEYLLDTCVLSENVKRQPNSDVIQWLDQQQEHHLFVSILTIAEIKKGIVRIENKQPTRSTKLALWVSKIKPRFGDRVLPITAITLDYWANLCGQAEANGKKLPVIDSLLAAIALEHQLNLVTRNTKDFQFTSIETINPWL